MALLKNIGKGILYIIGLPFFLIVLLGTAVFGLFMIVFLFFKSIFLFFTGRSLNDDLPEDIKAKAIKNGNNQTTPVEPESIINNQINRPSIEEVVFQDQIQPQQTNNNNEVILETIENEEPQFIDESNEEIATEEERPLFEDLQVDKQIESPVINNSDSIDIPAHKPAEKPKIETYIPKTDRRRFVSEEDDEEDNSGVTISYGDDDDD